MGKLQKFKLGQRFLDHLIQGILIFTSVFVAFWLNDYRLKKIEQRNSKAALGAVVNEIENNKAILERWAPRHQQIIDRAEMFMANSLDTVSYFNSIWLTEGQPIFQEIITYDSWDYIRQTNTKLPLDTRLLVNRIYRQQEYVENALKNLTNNFFNQRELFDEAKTRENYMIFYGLILELYGQEKSMIRQYQFALEQIKND